MTASDTTARITPYIEELLGNRYARENLRDALRALRSGRRKPRRRWGRRLLFVVGLGIAAAGIALAADDELRASILGSDGPAQQDPERTPAAPRSGPGLDGATRAQLYREAGRRGVAGRSKMTKAQLKAALSEGGRA